jgi:hypothetical protein
MGLDPVVRRKTHRITKTVSLILPYSLLSFHTNHKPFDPSIIIYFKKGAVAYTIQGRYFTMGRVKGGSGEEPHK